MLRPYKGLVISRLIYTLPLVKFVSLDGNLWKGLTESRCGSVLTYLSQRAFLHSEARDMPIQHYAAVRAFCHLKRMNWMASTIGIFEHRLMRKQL